MTVYKAQQILRVAVKGQDESWTILYIHTYIHDCIQRLDWVGGLY
jgi:hypothetical protein